MRAIADAGLLTKAIDGIIPIGIIGAPAEAFVANFEIMDLRLSAVRLNCARSTSKSPDAPYGVDVIIPTRYDTQAEEEAGQRDLHWLIRDEHQVFRNKD